MASTYEPIASQTLGSDTTTVTFDNIAASWTDLILVIHEATASGDNGGYLRFNQDSGTNYSRTVLRGNGSAASSSRNSSVSQLVYGGEVAGAIQIFHIMSYANTNVFKTVISSNRGLISTVDTVSRQVGLWRDTAAITRIDATNGTNGYKTGTTFSLFGIKASA